jgi:hypothetical protein
MYLYSVYTEFRAAVACWDTLISVHVVGSIVQRQVMYNVLLEVSVLSSILYLPNVTG